MADNFNLGYLLHSVIMAKIRYHQLKIRYHQLNEDEIRIAIQNMKEVYKPNPTRGLSSDILDVANYNDPAHRCAYLHKYAALHTALVRDMLFKSMKQVRLIFQDILADSGRLEICSLGGGPGSDILGVISVFSAEWGFFQLSATIIDCMDKWRHSFGAIIRELRGGNYGSISEFVQPQYFNWNYIGHNLLGKMSNDVNKAIHAANLITMVKFVSAAACKDTAGMVKKIFRSLKPGALVLFIDNDAGGFYRVVVNGAEECNMITVFGPLIHEHYSNMSFNVQRFGYKPCTETTVTVHMWMKPDPKRPDILSAASLDNVSRAQIRNMSNAYNQHNVPNGNRNRQHNVSGNRNRQNNNRRNRNFNPRRQHSGNNSSFNPIRTQPQYRRLPDPNDEEDMDCNNCCVIL